MKMTPEDYERLSEAVARFLAANDTSIVELREHYRQRGLSEMRLRWDLFWRTPKEEIDSLYRYLNDAHIDTALRRIVAGHLSGDNFHESCLQHERGH